MRKSTCGSLRGSGEASVTSPREYDLLTQKKIPPIRSPRLCQPVRDRIAPCMSPSGVPGRPEE